MGGGISSGAQGLLMALHSVIVPGDTQRTLLECWGLNPGQQKKPDGVTEKSAFEPRVV